MKTRFILLCHLLLGFIAPCVAAERVVAEWKFDQPAILKSWQPNADCKDLAIREGHLVFRTAGSDPLFTYSSNLSIAVTAWQAVEIRIKSNREGVMELFWSNTSEGKYGGFSQDKTTDFRVSGDNQWHTCRLLPFWHSQKKIVRLRLDPFDGANFELESIRIVEWSPGEPQKPEFVFSNSLAGWSAQPQATASATPGGMLFTGADDSGFVIAPAVRVEAAMNNYCSVSLTAQQGRQATLYFATERYVGLQTHSFPIVPDGKEHVYNVDLLQASGWRDRVIALGLKPTDAVNSPATLHWLKISDQPQGPAQLNVVSFSAGEAMPRAGRPFQISAVVANVGGTDAAECSATLTLVKGSATIRELRGTNAPSRLAFGDEARFAWEILSKTPQAIEAKVSLSALKSVPVTASTALNITASPKIARTDYVPEPKPVRGPYEVGAYYFPGWKSSSQWQPIQRFPERRPVLGWYQDANPEVVDWQIKYAVEHGITFFAYDWYWSKGSRQLEEGLHDGYFKARYRNMLKFCLLWANHNPPGSSSYEDCIAVTRYWIDNYFKRPEHLTIGGKPVMIIFSTDRFTSDLGSEGVKKAFEGMRAECQKAGLPGLYLIACVGSAGQARVAALEGYDAVTAYNWPGLNMPAGDKLAPFESLAVGYERQWRHILEQGSIPLMLPICGGWDSRPWHGEAALVRHTRTPELFERHLLDAKKLLHEPGQTNVLKNFLLVEAWNEWGEGSYIEPHSQYGFGYLEAIRKVCVPGAPTHVDITPGDIGRGPYDVAQEDFSKSAWTFDKSVESWNNVMDMTAPRIENGALTARSTGRDPAFFGPPMRARASEYSQVKLRLRLTSTGGQTFDDGAQLFWATTRLPESEATTVHFKVPVDGQWHDYTLSTGANPRWRGFITKLRLDPVTRPDVNVELGGIELAR